MATTKVGDLEDEELNEKRRQDKAGMHRSTICGIDRRIETGIPIYKSGAEKGRKRNETENKRITKKKH